MSECWLLGDPVAHSISPLIHQHFAHAAGINLSYSTRLTRPESCQSVVAQLFADGAVGINLTAPLKTTGLACCDRLTPAAEQAAAVNTLYIHQGQCWGDNTDGNGFIYDYVHHYGGTLSHCTILILGTGGVARGLIYPLLQAGVRRIWVWSRTARHCAQFVQHYADQRLEAYPHDCQHSVDIVINATSLGHREAWPDSVKAWLPCHGLAFYDVNYGHAAQSACDWARAGNYLRVADGLGMLVAQAAFAFARWFHVMPDITEVRRVVIAQHKQQFAE